MFTQCPHCATTFSVTDEHLAIANGTVRCGICHELFNAKDHFFIHSKDDYTTSKITHTDTPNDPESSSPEFGQRAADHQDSLPDILRHSSVARSSKPLIQILFTTLSILAGLMLCLQLIAFYNNQWLPERLRPVSCKWLSCPEKNAVRDTSTIEVLNRSVYSHPDLPNVLKVTATFVNRARQNQTFPDVELILLDVHGDPVAGRRFKPYEYLTQPHRTERIMRAHEVIAFDVEIQDPGAEVVGYTFNFL